MLLCRCVLACVGVEIQEGLIIEVALFSARVRLCCLAQLLAGERAHIAAKRIIVACLCTHNDAPAVVRDTHKTTEHLTPSTLAGLITYRGELSQALPLDVNSPAGAQAVGQSCNLIKCIKCLLNACILSCIKCFAVLYVKHTT